MMIIIISIFGGFAIVHWPAAPLNFTTNIGLTCYYEGRWPKTGKFCGWQYFQNQEEDVMPTDY